MVIVSITLIAILAGGGLLALSSFSHYYSPPVPADYTKPTFSPNSLDSFNRLYSLDQSVATELARNNPTDEAVLDFVSNQFLNLGLYGTVDVLNPSTGGYVQQELASTTIQAISNCSVAVYEGLPQLSRDEYFKLGNATQINPEIADFSQLNVLGSDLFKDSAKIPQRHYTLARDLEQCPYLLSKPQSFEFVNGLHRQHDFVMEKIGLNPADNIVRETYVTPDIDYYFNVLSGKKLNVNGTELTFPLLPLIDGTNMKDQFPDKTDREVIYASQFSIQLASYDATKGEIGNPTSRALLDNLRLVWNGGSFGNFHGTLFDRITKAYANPEMKSYDPPNNGMDWSDNQWARRSYDAKLTDFVLPSNFPEMTQTMNKFVDNIDPKLAADVKIDLGHRFVFGLALSDGAFITGEPHQYAPERTCLYAKALGASSITMDGKHPSHDFYFETASIPTQIFLTNSLPVETRYGPGQTICRFSAADSSIGLKEELPNGDLVIIP
jgi:hypothetical protein